MGVLRGLAHQKKRSPRPCSYSVYFIGSQWRVNNKVDRPVNKPVFDPAIGAQRLDTVSASIAMTNTGLDKLVHDALIDPGLNQQISDADIIAGATAAAEMNAIIVAAIDATGAANDGKITVDDVYAISDWIVANHSTDWTRAHGDDENDAETGFHKIQGDGNALYLFGDKMVNQVADGIYHLGFGYRDGSLINEDGDRNARVEEVAFWLDALLADDLAAGTLSNTAVSPEFAGTTGTGLDAVIAMINDDPGLQRRLPASDIADGAEAANAMNVIIIEGIKTLGLADDQTLAPSEVYALADWINANRLTPWLAAHGDDENNEETGFHLVQNDGGETRAFGRSGVNTVADAIYHLGFGYKGDRLINEDGNTNERVEDVTYWLNALLADDLASGALASGKGAPVQGTTGTGLDRLVNLISAESELNRRLSEKDIKDSAKAADTMNKIIVDGIRATGIANDDKITSADIKDLSDWIAQNHKVTWINAHGDDENNIETGFHLVQGDGAVERLYDHNAINTVADGLYHLGFGYSNGRLVNEDGNGNAMLSEVAFWLETLIFDDLADGSLRNANVDPYPSGSTGTALDEITQLITSDDGLTKRFSASELKAIANDVDALNGILVDAITATGVANDGSLTATDVAVIGTWIEQNAGARWSALRGDYDNADGIAGLAWKGGVGSLGHANAFNELGRAIYSLGFGTKHGGIRDADGDWVGALEDAAGWLNVLLADDLAASTFFNPDQEPVDPSTFARDTITSVDAVRVLDKDNYAVIDHNARLLLSEGTIAFTFTADQPSAMHQVLFAKDSDGSNDGDMRVYLHDGMLNVKFSIGGADHYLKIETTIKANVAHDVAVSFDSGGVSIWFDGIRQIFKDDVRFDMRANMSDVIVGASNGHQTGDDTLINAHFQGAITGFTIYDRALEQGEVAGLSQGQRKIGTSGDNNIAGSGGQDALFGGLGRDVIAAGDGNDVVAGGYGADRVAGGAGHDVLDGGHGQDVVNGGAGNDIIISRSDGREPMIGQLIYGSNGRVRGDDGSVDFDTLTVYSDQPIPGDDILTGGSGADIFRFQWLINAKEAIILKHVRADGSINWGGVAGENTYLHDHWVDTIGNDVITDFSRAEGDRIEVAGHTLTLKSMTYRDIDGDGVDETIIAYKSNQGNGGAHDQDDLGTITVYGDRVTGADITQIPSMSVLYGIVENVSELAEAVTPLSIDTGIARAMPGNLTPSDIDGPRGADLVGPKAKADAQPKAALRSNTGLDTILDWIETDPGLRDRTAAADITKGSAAAAAMNAIILQAIKATGAANDGVIDAGDVYALAGWISKNHKDDWLKHHGNDENGVETGFHLVQNDGASGDSYGRNSINTVADAIYHLGFGYKNDFLINEDGNTNQRVESVAFWLNELLADDLAGTSLQNANAPKPVAGRTGTGLDQLVQIIRDDPELSRRIPDAEQQTGAKAADTMNQIIVKHIKKLGLANDGVFTVSEVMALAESIKTGDYATWLKAHGDDADKTETGFHLVQNDGAVTQLFGNNAVNTIADGLYHLGFGYNKHGQLINEDGNANASTESVAHWMNELLADDMATLANPKVAAVISGSTRSGLDALVDIITGDAGLNRKISLTEINQGADAADAMNQIILQSIKATGIANDGRITAGDIATLASFIKSNHAEVWTWAHGNDADGIETTFHRVHGDGGDTRLYGKSAIDTVADGLYHLGFGHKDGRLLNKDGKANASFSDVAFWLEDLLSVELASGRLENTNTGPFFKGTTGTGLDTLVEMVATDEGLLANLPSTELSKAAKAADGLNKILIQAIQQTGVANDGIIDVHDIKIMDAWIAENQREQLDRFNGTETDDKRTGFEIAEIWSSTSPLFGENGVNTVADSLYSIGYGIKYNNAVSNRDGGWQAALSDAADWLNLLLEQDLATGSLFTQSQKYAAPSTFAEDIVVATTRPMVGDGQGGFINIAHTSAQALKHATVSFSFTANDIPAQGQSALFTKDARDNGEGGHTALYFNDGELYLRVQSKDKSHYLKVAERGQFQTGTQYALALVLGDNGIRIFVDGQQVASNLHLKMNWENNAEDIVVGASGGWRKKGAWDGVHSAFDGRIDEFTVYDRTLTFGEIAGLTGVNIDVPPTPGAIVPDVTDPAPADTQDKPNPAPITDVDDAETATEAVIAAADSSDMLGTAGGTKTGSNGVDILVGLSGKNDLDGAAGNDLLIGGFQNDTLSGGAGNDALIGDMIGTIFAGDDVLYGGTGNDMLQGGGGADIFGFGVNEGDDIIADFGMVFTDVGAANGFQTTPTGRDFEVGIDKIKLTGFGSVAEGAILTGGALRQTDDGTLFSADGTSILMYGVNLNTLSESDFVFG